MGEVIHGDYASDVTAGGLDSVTQYELWKAIWSSFNDRNLYELAWALNRHNALLEAFVPHAFVGNHDVTRIASRLSDERHLDHALVILCAVGGIPAIYSGDEQAFRGVKEDREGGDDEIRPAFPGRPVRAGRARPSVLPAPPGPHRVPAAASVAGPRPYDGHDADRHRDRLHGRGRGPRRGGGAERRRRPAEADLPPGTCCTRPEPGGSRDGGSACRRPAGRSRPAAKPRGPRRRARCGRRGCPRTPRPCN
jgi:hypothetical protein